MAVQFVSSNVSIAEITVAATADTSKPNVYLNVTETTAGATQMTVTAWSATSCTFTDPPGAPIGSLKLGLENTRDLSIGWIDVTVNAPQLSVGSGTPSIDAITVVSIGNVFGGVESTPSIPTITASGFAVRETHPAAHGSPSIDALTVTASTTLTHPASSAVSLPEITVSATAANNAPRRATGTPSLPEITVAATTSGVPQRPTGVDVYVLLQDSTVGEARIEIQSDAASFILLQRTFGEDEIIQEVAPEASKGYYLQQEPDEYLFYLEDLTGFVLLESSKKMADQIEIQIPLTRVPEETTFTATAYFRTRSTKTASVPTTVHYRVDCLTTRQVIADWQLVATPAESNDIVMTSAYNQILDDAHRNETKQLTVKVDDGLSSQVIKTRRYKVDNIHGIT